jgi:hypothetical protein
LWPLKCYLFIGLEYWLRTVKDSRQKGCNTKEKDIMMKNKLLLTAACLALSVAVSIPLASGAAHADDHHGHKGKGRHAERLQEVDTNGDGLVSKAEFMAQQEKRFNELDANSDGQIDQDEHKAFRGKMKERFKEMREKRQQRMQERQKDVE